MKRLFIAGHRGMVGSALVREAALVVTGPVWTVAWERPDQFRKVVS